MGISESIGLIDLDGLVASVPLKKLIWCSKCNKAVGVIGMTYYEGNKDAFLACPRACPLCGKELCYNDNHNVSEEE